MTEPSTGAARYERVFGTSRVPVTFPHHEDEDGVGDIEHPVPFSTVVLRDPDNIQLELIHMPG